MSARQHLVQSAGYWFNAARVKASEGFMNEALTGMENAYNHVENALAAERDKTATLEAENQRLRDAEAGRLKSEEPAPKRFL